MPVSGLALASWPQNISMQFAKKEASKPGQLN